MLGLGNSIVSGGYVPFSPDDISNILLWFQSNSNLTSNLLTAKFNSANVEYDPVRTDGNLTDGDRIQRWGGQGGTAFDFFINVSTDMPRFEADAGEGLSFPAGKYMDLVEAGTTTDDTIDFTGAFTVFIRCKPTNLDTSRALLGQSASAQEFIRIGASGAAGMNKSVRLKIDNNNVDFTESTNTISTSEYISILIERDSSNVCKMYVYSDTYKATASGTQWGGATTQSGTATFDNLSSTEDDTQNFVGFISHVIVYSKQITAAERTELFSYVK
jgi:hypothetical protein